MVYYTQEEKIKELDHRVELIESVLGGLIELHEKELLEKGIIQKQDQKKQLKVERRTAK